jgi:hypothetical protein
MPRILGLVPPSGGPGRGCRAVRCREGRAAASTIECSYNGEKYLDVRDTTFTGADRPVVQGRCPMALSTASSSPASGLPEPGRLMGPGRSRSEGRGPVPWDAGVPPAGCLVWARRLRRNLLRVRSGSMDRENTRGIGVGIAADSRPCLGSRWGTWPTRSITPAADRGGDGPMGHPPEWVACR